LKVEQENWTSAENSVFWPEKLLATQIPKARILAFEYDDDPTLDAFWNKRDLISSNSDDLVNSLLDERRGETVSMINAEYMFVDILTIRWQNTGRATFDLCCTLSWRIGR
jgi:hypothetical protein